MSDDKWERKAEADRRDACANRTWPPTTAEEAEFEAALKEWEKAAYPGALISNVQIAHVRLLKAHVALMRALVKESGR